MENKDNTKKFKILTTISTVLASIGGAILVVSSILSLLIMLNILRVPQNLFMLIDAIVLGIIVIMFIVSYFIYAYVKKQTKLNETNNKKK